MNPLSYYKLFRTYRKILSQEKPDVVLTYSIKPNIYGETAAVREKTQEEQGEDLKKMRAFGS